jgi:hypothetical protein
MSWPAWAARAAWKGCPTTLLKTVRCLRGQPLQSQRRVEGKALKYSQKGGEPDMPDTGVSPVIRPPAPSLVKKVKKLVAIKTK